MLDVQCVRSQFPALSDGWAYFDNAGGSQVLKSVAERISDYLLTTSVQTGASYEPSLRASARLAEARAKMAMFIGASRPEEVVFGHSTTVLVRFLATAMASQLSAGDEMVVTDFDHESNIGPWLMLQERGDFHQGLEHQSGRDGAGDGGPRQSYDGADAAGVRDPRVEHSRHNQSNA